MSETAETSAPVEQAQAEPEVTLDVMQAQETEQPEAQPEPEAKEKDPPAQKVVPLAALHEERRARRELQEQIRLGNERLNQLQQLVQRQANPPLPLPDKSQDAVGYFDAKTQQLEQAIQPLQQEVTQFRQQRAMQEQIQQLTRHVTAQEQQFAAQNPDYIEAVNHVKRTSFQGLKALGYDDAQAAQAVEHEFLRLCDRLARSGESIPEHIYNTAKANGYKATPKASLETQQRGVAKAKTLGSGASTSQNLNMEALAAMPPDEFAEAVKDEKLWRKLMGG